jgi:hypothetical protein
MVCVRGHPRIATGTAQAPDWGMRLALVIMKLPHR